MLSRKFVYIRSRMKHAKKVLRIRQQEEGGRGGVGGDSDLRGKR